MKKILLILLILGVICGCREKKGEKIKIGITQIIEHAALDEVVMGFKEALKDKGYDETKIEIDYQIAQGDFGIAQTIADSYVQNNEDLVLAISTPSSQAMYNATKKIPIIVAAVTDPISSGLIGNNITGITDIVPIEKQLKLIKNLLPTAKKIGVVYNTSEENSLIMLKMLKKESIKYGYEIVEKGITNINEIGQAMDIILKEVDVFYTPTDNLIVSATPLVLAKAKENKIPVIGCIEEQVKQGALATETISYRNSGYQAGKIAIEILNGKEPKDIPIKTLEDTILLINKKSMVELGIKLPEELRKKAIIIEK